MKIWQGKHTGWLGFLTDRRCNNARMLASNPAREIKFNSNIMLENYFKIAMAILKRRKFFTFISLFGISFTLTILIVLTAFIDKIVDDDYPNAKNDRSLYVRNLEQTGGTNGNFSSSSGLMSFYFLDHYVGSLKTPAKIAISSIYKSTNTYVNNKKIVIDYKYTNAAYWEALDYEFLEGKPFTSQQVMNGDLVTIISEDIKTKYFGDMPSVVGKFIEANNVQYRVCGVVRNVPITSYLLYGEMYLPYTVSKGGYQDHSYRGDYLAILLAGSRAEVPKMQEEFDQMVRKIPMESKQYDTLYCHADSYLTGYLRTGNEANSGMTYAILAITIFVFIFMLLPTLNLVNINITRIMERSSEIGVRKAFGASSKTLVYQFIIENLILTLLGGMIGFILSAIILQCFNSADLIPNLRLSLSLTVFFVGMITCLIFGLLSGVYPAWRMSKMNVIHALKEQ
jgi:putative ABC transport system permease protein